jgi:hypothetical protein
MLHPTIDYDSLSLLVAGHPQYGATSPQERMAPMDHYYPLNKLIPSKIYNKLTPTTIPIQ